MKYRVYKQLIPVKDSDPPWAQRNVYVAKLNTNDKFHDYKTKSSATTKITALKKLQKHIGREFKIIKIN